MLPVYARRLHSNPEIAQRFSKPPENAQMTTTGTMQPPVTMPVGEYLYNTRLQLTGFTDYGVSLQYLS